MIINVTVVYMERDVMILMRTNPLHLRLGPENRDFFGPQMLATIEVSFWPEKVEIFGAYPFQWPEKWIYPRQNN